MRNTVRYICYAIGLCLLALFVFQTIELSRYKSNQNSQALETAAETTTSLKAEISALLSRVEAEGERIGGKFGEKELSVEEVKYLIKQVSLDVPEIRGIAACYKPEAFLKGRRLFCPYYDKGPGDYIFVEDSYDYTVKGEGTAWYTDIIENGATWVDPYYGAGSKAWYVDYGVPFYYQSGPKKGQVRGMIGFSIDVGDFKNLIHSISVGKTGYSFITSRNGTFITHPISDYVGTKTLDDVIATEINPEWRKAYQGMKARGSGSVQFFDRLSNDTSIIYYDHVPTSDYGIGLVFFKNDLTENKAAINRRYIKMALTLSALLIIFLVLYFGRDVLDRVEIEVLSVLVSVLMIANVFFIGTLQHSVSVNIDVNESPPIVDNSSLGNFVDQQHARADVLKIPHGTPVPTGIYIDSLAFEDNYNVNLSGVVWQKYPTDIAEAVTIGFRFPQISPFAESSFIEETYRQKIEPQDGVAGYVLVRSDFRVTLRLNLKYKNYPFDKRHLDIEIQPLLATDNLIFIPDLDSFKITNPAQKSGLSPKIKLSGNTIMESYFNFSLESYDTSFGGLDYAIFQNVPILHYNIHMKRKLLNAFVTYLIPIGVSLVLIYILIMACSKSEARQGIIESMAAFFFVLIFSHIDLRKDVVTADLIFMEYFYFATYLMIILSTLNLMIYTKDRSPIFDFNNNQLFRISYFPIFLILILWVMLAKFY